MIVWPYYKCQLQKGDVFREVYLPVWECVENVEVSLDGGDMWKVVKILHQISEGRV